MKVCTIPLRLGCINFLEFMITCCSDSWLWFTLHASLLQPVVQLVTMIDGDNTTVRLRCNGSSKLGPSRRSWLIGFPRTRRSSHRKCCKSTLKRTLRSPVGKHARSTLSPSHLLSGTHCFQSPDWKLLCCNWLAVRHSWNDLQWVMILVFGGIWITMTTRRNKKFSHVFSIMILDIDWGDCFSDRRSVRQALPAWFGSQDRERHAEL